MTLKHAAELTQVVIFGFGEIAEIGKRGIQTRGCMSLAEYEAVAFGHLRTGRVVFHLISVERGHDLYRGKRSARMTGAGLFQHGDDVPTDHGTLRLERFQIHDIPPDAWF